MPFAEKKIIFEINGREIEVEYLEDVDLRVTLRDRIQEKNPGVNSLEIIKDSVYEMTYQHALMMTDLPIEGYSLQVKEGPKVELNDLVSEDLGDSKVLRIVLTPKVYKEDAIRFLDFDSDAGAIRIPYAEGGDLEALLKSCKAPVNSRTIRKGMTYNDVKNLLKYKYNTDIGNVLLRDHVRKQDVKMDAFVDKKVALSEGITLIAAAAIEGNE